MFPLVEELAFGFLQLDRFAVRDDFGGVKGVTPARGLCVDGFEIRGNGDDRVTVRAETNELRVVPVAFGQPAQDFLREESFAPEGDKALGVEVFGMQSPDAHERRKPNFTVVGES